MKGTLLRAMRLSVAQALDVWGRSDEASAFTHPLHLERLADDVEWWGVDRSGEIVAAWPLVGANFGGELASPPFCYYIGPMFSRSLQDRKTYARYWWAYTSILTALVEAVTEAHPRFRFSLPLGVLDIRVFQWWNHDHPDRAGFVITPRYTARIDLSRHADDEALLQSFAGNRKRSVRRWAAAPPQVVDDVDTERLVDLDRQTVTRSGGTATSQRQEALRRMIELVRSGAGAILGLIPPGATQVETGFMMLDGADECNAILNATSDDWQAEELTAWTVWLGLQRCRSTGKRWFDFNGANSPGRAADRHYYSAEEVLYVNGTFERT